MIGEIHSRRVHGFDVGVEELWTALTDVDRYRVWWPWLVRFDAGAFAAGETWHCTVRPPLRYRVSFELTLDEVHAAARADATIRGDIVGTAELRVREAGEGSSELELNSHLAPSSRWLRRLNTVARPITTRGHDWVLDTGLRQFRTRAFDLD